MKISSKTTATLIALFLTLTIAATLVAFPAVNAQTINYYTTFVYVSASPEVIGVGQEMLLVTWTAEMPPDIGEAEGLVPGGRAAWYDIKIEVTMPEGDTETFTIEKTDPVGGGFVIYTPTAVGTYSIQALFPETTKTFPDGDQNIYSAAKSRIANFTVQEEKMPPFPESPLTGDYWSRPINSASREWYQLAGNWLAGAADVWPLGASGGTTNSFAYGLAPESAHILWTKPYYAGGIMDERFGDYGFQTSHYQGIRFRSVIILNGIINYQPRYTAHWSRGWARVDLYTGETLFLDYNATAPSFGQIYNYESPNQHGGFAYLWRTSDVELPDNVSRIVSGGIWPNYGPEYPETVELIERPGTQTWEMLDATTGYRVCYVANVSAGGTAVYGKDGSILRYNIANLGTRANPNYYLQVWNSSAIRTMLVSNESTWAWQWRPQWGGHGNYGFRYRENVDAFHDGDDGGFSLNVSIPSDLPTRIYCVREGEYLIVGTGGRNDERGAVEGEMTALSLEYGNEGTKLWDTKFTPPAGSYAANVSVSLSGVYPEDGVIVFEDRKNQIRWVYSLETGEQLWKSEPEPQMNYYGMSEYVYQGMLISYGSYSGQLIAYNITTGEILWTYTTSNVGKESPYGNYPISIGAIADGKIYTYADEHSPTQPLWRGPNLRCINATTGEEIWSILDFGRGLFIADGYLIDYNYFDNSIYCFGRGPSATTVSAPQLVPTVGSSVVITGTVTDQTATGRRNTNDILDFTLKGTPAISDEDMGAWMEYLFMDQAKPADAKGVEVVLETLDPNGNFYEIGRTTSDINGNYGIMWEPPVPGEYQIIATFAGSASYGPSYATTYMGVAEAPEPTPAPTPTPASIADMYLVPATIGIIIAIIAVGVIIVLMLRKR